MDHMNLQVCVEELFARETEEFGEEYFRAFDELKAALNEGLIRAAEPDPSSPTGWKVNTWVKKGILLGFRIGRVVEMPVWQPGAGGDPCDGDVRMPSRRHRPDGPGAAIVVDAASDQPDHARVEAVQAAVLRPSGDAGQQRDVRPGA